MSARARLLLTVITVVTFAALGTAGGSWLGWRSPGELPTDAQAWQIAALITDGGENAALHRHDEVAGSEYPEDTGPIDKVLGDDWYAAGNVELVFPATVTGLPAAAARLRAAGWRTGGTGGGELTAARADWRLVLTAAALDSPAELRIERAEPLSGLLLTVLFTVAGGVLGVFVARRRLDLFALLGLGFLAFNTVTAMGALAGDLAARLGTGPFPLPWAGFTAFGARPMSLIGVPLLAIGLLRPVRPRSRRTVAAAAAAR